MSLPPPHILLTIAGHDPSSGAGITADLQVFAAFGCFGVSAITALTVQSTVGVAELQAVEPLLLGRCLDCLVSDLPPAGIKIGMLGSAAIAGTVADFLHRLAGGGIDPAGLAEKEGTDSGSGVAASDGVFGAPVVLDPILRASSRASLLEPGGLEILHERLLPAVNWITPNWSELGALTAMPVNNLAEAESAAHALGARHPRLHIVATGGDCAEPIDLLRSASGEIYRFAGEHIATTSTHGTGCAFSSALLCRLVLGDTPAAAVGAAKAYVAEALRQAPGIGHGRGPLSLLWPLSVHSSVSATTLPEYSDPPH